MGGFDFFLWEGIFVGGDSGSVFDMDDIDSSFLLVWIFGGEMLLLEKGVFRVFYENEVVVICFWI